MEGVQYISLYTGVKCGCVFEGTHFCHSGISALITNPGFLHKAQSVLTWW